MWKRKKYFIGGFLIFAAIGALAFNAFWGSSVYYYTVSELLSQKDSLSGYNVRVNGKVMVGSIEESWDSQGQVFRFTIADGENSLPVVYRGTVPDAFKEDAEVVVEGKYNSAGVFTAAKLVAKCPAKFTPAEEKT